MGQLTKTTAELNKMLTPSQISVYLASPYSMTLTGGGTYDPIQATLTDGTMVDFTPRGTPDFDFVFTGNNGSCMLFIGDAEFETTSGAADDVTFALFLNDVEFAKFTSAVTVEATSTARGFGANGLIELDTNDVLDIRAKCDGASKSLQINAMKVTLLLVELT